VQLDNLDRFTYNSDSDAKNTTRAVEMGVHPLFWHDSNQYLVVRDSNDHVSLNRVKVQMDMALANSLNASNSNPEGTTKMNYQPQDGKFLDVYSGPN